MQIWIRGKGKTRWFEKDEDYKKEVKGEEESVNAFLNVEDFSKTEYIDPGQNSYPFSISIPSHFPTNLEVESIADSDFSLQYELVALISTGDTRVSSLKGKKEI